MWKEILETYKCLMSSRKNLPGMSLEDTFIDLSSLEKEYEWLKQQIPETCETYVVRLWNMFDGWINVTDPLSLEEARLAWNTFTERGTQKTKYEDGDY